MLVDEGAIVIDGERWTLLHDKLQAARVPPTLTGVLQARLDSLKPREKQALQQAAVVGFVFWDQALAAIDRSAPEALPGVARRELVVRQPEASLDGVREYAFHHHLLHQVTYGTVLKRLRRTYHARAAAWLAGLTGARANDFLGLAAQHYEQAGERPPRRRVLRPCRRARRQPLRQRDGGRPRRAGAGADRGRRRAGVAAPCAFACLRCASGRSTCRGAAPSIGPTSKPWRRSRSRSTTTGCAPMRRSGAAPTRCASPIATPRWRPRAGREPGPSAPATSIWSCARRTCWPRASAISATWRPRGPWRSRALAAARAHGLRRVEGSFLNTLALIAVRLDDLAGHLEMGRQQWQLFRDMGDVPAQAVARLHLGISLLGAGEQAQSREHLERRPSPGARGRRPGDGALCPDLSGDDRAARGRRRIGDDAGAGSAGDLARGAERRHPDHGAVPDRRDRTRARPDRCRRGGLRTRPCDRGGERRADALRRRGRHRPRGAGARRRRGGDAGRWKRCWRTSPRAACSTAPNRGSASA